MTIRLARAEDVSAIRRCATEAYGKYIESMGMKPAPMLADFEAQVHQGIVQVAIDDLGELQGFIVFYPRSDHVHLENVAVSPRHQGRGIGKGLIEFCEQMARAQGFPAIELYTNRKMTENLDLYPALGYLETGRRVEDGFDRVFFRKELS